MCGKCGEVTATRGDKHVHLGMNIWFKKDGSVEMDMKEDIRNMPQEFPIKFKTEVKCTFPASATMFSNDMSGKLDKHRSELFHRFVAMVLFFVQETKVGFATNRSNALCKDKGVE